MPVAVVPATEQLLAECLAFDHLAAAGESARRAELQEAVAQGRMRVASLDGHAVGYAVRAPWFFGQSFLELLYVAPDMRRRGIAQQLLVDFEERHGPSVFTSTNQSNLAMQSLLRHRGWTDCGRLEGLDEDDAEIFFVKRASTT